MKNWCKRGVFIVTFVVMLLFLVTSLLYASDPGDYRKEIEELKARIEMLEKKMEQAEKERKEIKEASKELESIKEKFENLSISIGITGVVQGTVNNEDNSDEGDVTDGSYSADLEFEADFKRWGTGYIHLEAGGGEGITDEVPALTGVNADAGDSQDEVDVSEAWWEFKPLNNDILTVTVGKLDPTAYFDANEVANDETSQFLADAFVNSIVVEWPDYTPGLRIQISPVEFVDLNLGVFSAESDWEDLFDDVFAIGEINIKPKLFGDLEGNYRLYGWVNGLDHVEWDDFKKSGYNTSIVDDKKNYGFGISLDQKLPYDITIFARVGFQDDDIAGVSGSLDEVFGASWMWSAGFQIAGKAWSRPDDVLGIAIGQAILSNDFEDYLKNEGIDPDDETHLEIYYNLYLNDHISLSPDFQLIDNLGGDKDADTVYIFGLRSQISF